MNIKNIKCPCCKSTFIETEQQISNIKQKVLLSNCEHSFIINFVRNEYFIFFRFNDVTITLSKKYCSIQNKLENDPEKIYDFPKTNKLNEYFIIESINFIYSCYENIIFI